MWQGDIMIRPEGAEVTRSHVHLSCISSFLVADLVLCTAHYRERSMAPPMSNSTPPRPVSTSALTLKRQLAELTKNPVDGFSAGAVSNLYISIFAWLRYAVQALLMIEISTNGRSWSLGECTCPQIIRHLLTLPQATRHPLVCCELVLIRQSFNACTSEGGFFKARLNFPEQYPLLPPKMKFLSEMWHPSSTLNNAIIS